MDQMKPTGEEAPKTPEQPSYQELALAAYAINVAANNGMTEVPSSEEAYRMLAQASANRQRGV